MVQAQTNTNQWHDPELPRQFVQVTETAANDSNKTLTVPAGVVWEVLHVYASLVATATAGNRNMRLIIGDGSNELARSDASAVQIANATEYYHWNPTYHTPAETVATQHTIPLPISWLPAGYTVQVLDSAAVDAAADDLTIRVHAIEHKV